MVKLSKRDEQLLLGLIVVGIILAIYYLMIIPFKNNLKETNEKNTIARNEYEELINANNRPELFQENLKKLQEGIEQKEAMIPESISELELYEKAEEVKGLLSNGSIKYDVVGAEKTKTAVKNKVAISFSTTYESLEGLIKDIVAMKEKTAVDNINFTIDNNRLIGTMDVYFYSKA